MSVVCDGCRMQRDLPGMRVHGQFLLCERKIIVILGVIDGCLK